MSQTSRGAGVLPLLREAIDGLSSHPRELPPKLFYDARGARLFEEITRLDEYYLTRTERAILEQQAESIAATAGTGGVVIEYGSGAAEKVRLLLDALAPHAYVPVDVSEEQLLDVADAFTLEHPGIAVYPVAADFTAPFNLPTTLPAEHRIGMFLGSTVGNLHPEEARAFLHRIAAQLGDGGTLILGVDLKKSPNVLHAAYNDARGVTAAFNRNMLERLHRDFDVRVCADHFAHYAFFNPIAGRVEMHLVATKATDIHIDHNTIHFAPGEGIWTESSYKYTMAELSALAHDGGFTLVNTWTDPRQWFAVAVLRVGLR